MKFLRFDVLQLEASHDCRYDYVAIFEGSRINNTRLLGILRKYSEYIPKIFQKYSENILKIFQKYSAQESIAGTRQLCLQSESLMVGNLFFNSSKTDA